MEPNESPEVRKARNGSVLRRTTEELDERVRKLEAAVAEFRDADDVDEAVAERAIAKLLTARQAGPLRLAPADGVLTDGTEAVAVVPASPPVEPPAPTPPPAEALPSPPRGAILRPPEMIEAAIRRGWILLQLWSELRLLPQMYFDPRYRLSRTAQFAAPAALLLFAANYFLFQMLFSIPVLSPVLERLVCVVIGVLLYRVMARELTRYREVLDYLSKYGFR